MAQKVAQGEGIWLDVAAKELWKKDGCSTSRRVACFSLIFFAVVSLVIGVVGLSMRGGPIVRSLGRSRCVALTVVGAPFILFLLASTSRLRTNSLRESTIERDLTVKRGRGDNCVEADSVEADVVGLAAEVAAATEARWCPAADLPTYLSEGPPESPNLKYRRVGPGQKILQPGEWSLTEGGHLVVKTHPFLYPTHPHPIEYSFNLPVLQQRPPADCPLFAQLFTEKGGIFLYSSLGDSGEVIVLREQKHPVLSPEGVRRLIAHYGWWRLTPDRVVTRFSDLGRIDDETIFECQAYSLVSQGAEAALHLSWVQLHHDYTPATNAEGALDQVM